MPTDINDTVTFAKRVTHQGAVDFVAGTISGAALDTATPAPVAATRKQYLRTYGQSGNAAAATVPIHHAKSAGTVTRVRVGSVVAATGDSTATIDVKINGTTTLTATVVLDNGNTAYIAENGSVSGGGTYSAGDVITVIVTVSAGTGTLPTGLFVAVTLDEAP